MYHCGKMIMSMMSFEQGFRWWTHNRGNAKFTYHFSDIESCMFNVVGAESIRLHCWLFCLSHCFATWTITTFDQKDRHVFTILYPTHFQVNGILLLFCTRARFSQKFTLQVTISAILYTFLFELTSYFSYYFWI